jgi:hypothetical protein
MSTHAKRVLGVTVGTLVVLALIGIYIGIYLVQAPPSVAATSTAQGDQLYVATVPAGLPSDAHNTWVSYYAVDANSNHWLHATTYTVPAHTLVHMTIYQYDSASGFRNEFFGQVEGTQGGTMQLDGKTTQAIDPSDAAHAFAVPAIGLYVPLEGISSNAKNPCSNAPCTLKNDHHTISFTFRTPGKGLYRWQCLVPCAAGFIEGFGGPMQTVGYMDGYLKVV